MAILFKTPLSSLGSHCGLGASPSKARGVEGLGVRADLGLLYYYYANDEIMGKEGSSFYDDEIVFETYLRHRQRLDTPNDTLEKPVILEIIGAIANKHILDLGCGDAAIGREFLHNGAASYIGIEASQKMVALAKQTLVGTSGQVIWQKIEDWQARPETFDLVLARLLLHYIADLAPIFLNVYRTLVPGGRFIFSVEHPVITSCDRGWKSGTLRQDWVVDDYFSTGLRVTNHP
jgi:SAM-dependent methyltransferase